MRLVILERARIDDAAAREGQAGLLLQPGDFVGEPVRELVLAVAEHGIEQAVDILQRRRAIGDAALRGRNLEHRLEPMHAARAVADDPDFLAASGCGSGEHLRNLVRAAGDGGCISRHINFRAHRVASLTS